IAGGDGEPAALEGTVAAWTPVKGFIRQVAVGPDALGIELDAAPGLGGPELEAPVLDHEVPVGADADGGLAPPVGPQAVASALGSDHEGVRSEEHTSELQSRENLV